MVLFVIYYLEGNHILSFYLDPTLNIKFTNINIFNIQLGPDTKLLIRKVAKLNKAIVGATILMIHSAILCNALVEVMC